MALKIKWSVEPLTGRCDWFTGEPLEDRIGVAGMSGGKAFAVTVAKPDQVAMAKKIVRKKLLALLGDSRE